MKQYDIIVETVKGSNLKHKYDPATGLFFLKKALPLGMIFPYDFGFIPGSIGDDGDPLDALLISEFGSFTGCRIQCRLIGALLAQQTEGRKKLRNDRFFFVPSASVTFSGIKNIGELGKNHNGQLRDFFINYNEIEGKVFKPLKWLDADNAEKLISRSKID